MKKHLSIRKQRIVDNQKSLSRKNNIIRAIQIATLGVVCIMVFASVYGNA